MFFRCRTWHVSGVIFVKCFFFFPLLPYSISCVFNVLLPYTSGIFLFMCDYWSCIIGWVCLTTAGVLCSPSDLYMPVHPMCNKPLYCFWCVSSCVTVTETGFSPSLTLLQNYVLWQHWEQVVIFLSCQRNWEKFVSVSKPKFLEIACRLLVKLDRGHLHLDAHGVHLCSDLWKCIFFFFFKLKRHLTEPLVRNAF